MFEEIKNGITKGMTFAVGVLTVVLLAVGISTSVKADELPPTDANTIEAAPADVEASEASYRQRFDRWFRDTFRSDAAKDAAVPESEAPAAIEGPSPSQDEAAVKKQEAHS